MRTKVVLTMMPFFNHVFTPPIPLAYLKAYLQQNKDITVRTIDLEARCYRSDLIKQDRGLYWQKVWSQVPARIGDKEKKFLDTAVERILVHNPDVVGFSISDNNRIFTSYVAERLKKIHPRVYIIYGGRRFCRRKGWRCIVGKLHKDLPEVDCIVKNEGEAALLEVVTAINSGSRPDYCRGATLRKGEEIIDGGERPYIENLDTIPFPDFSDFKKQDYLSDYIRILFSRGCAGRCSYCAENDYMGEGVRYRSPQNIVEEIKLRISQGYRRFQTCDLSLNSDHRILREVCEFIIKENLNVEFLFGEFKHSALLTKDLITLCRAAGFKKAVFGTESGSQTILNKMRKGVKSRVIGQNIKDMHEAGLQVILYLMVGFPGETEETFQETLSLLRVNGSYIDAIAFAAPTSVCPGTGIHDNLEDYDVDTQTLFQTPDRWKSRDGSNNFDWRFDLQQRLYRYVAEMAIPLISYNVDGNPRVPVLAIRLPPGEPISVKNIDKKQNQRPPADSHGFSAQMRCNDVSSKVPAIFLITVTNAGKKEWRRGSGDTGQFRAGCRVYTEGDDASVVLELRRELPRKVILPEEAFSIDFFIDNESLNKGRYQIRFDMVYEHKFWFGDVGSSHPIIQQIEVT